MQPEQNSQIDGLLLVDNFISPEEQSFLIKQILKRQWNTSLKRRTQHYGYEYSYDRKSIATKTEEIPEPFVFIKQRIEKLVSEIYEQQKNPQPVNFDQVIVNEYEPGQGINPHIDNVELFTDNVVSLSLGSDVIMCFEGKTQQKVEEMLRRRSVLILRRAARYEWKHSIASRKKDNGVPRQTRYSLTFRQMK